MQKQGKKFKIKFNTKFRSKGLGSSNNRLNIVFCKYE